MNSIPVFYKAPPFTNYLYWIIASRAVYNSYIKKEGFCGKEEDNKKRKANTSVQNTSDFLIPEEPGGCFAEGWE